MVTATLPLPLPHHEPLAAPAARLALKADGTSGGLLDGAWWPRSRDLLSELPTLADVLDPLWGRITRIAVNPKYWPVIPHHIPVDSHVVKAGWFTPEIAQLMVVDVLVVRDERVGDHVQAGDA